jgi:ABC-type antimicrobial peptide transport system permease subunit
VLLSAIGLFALTAHVVAWMTPEIGVRAALGARPHHVLKRVLRRAAAQVIVGIVVGVAFALAWNRLLGSAQSPSNTSVLDFVIAAVALTLVSMAACLIPAIRALRVNPLVALRYD